MPLKLKNWPGSDAASRRRQWPRIVELAERVAAAPHLTGLFLLGSFARGEADGFSDVDFMVVLADGRFDEAWERRHELHPPGSACWDYPRPDEREVAAHRWLTDDLVLFDGLISTTSGARLAEPFVLLVGEDEIAAAFQRFDPKSSSAAEIEPHELERLYGRLKLAARRAVRAG